MNNPSLSEKGSPDGYPIPPPSATAPSIADDAPSIVVEQPESETNGPAKCGWLSADPWVLDGSESVPNDGDHWKHCRDLLATLDRTTAGTWKDEIENQLVVSALLSAVTTAFALQVQNDSSDNASLLLLSQIALQANKSAILPVDVFADNASIAGPYARLTTAFLYASLALSLANVTLGTLCLQWVRELVNEAPGISHDAYCDLREVRFNGFDKGARGFVLVLPLLLLFSLLSFFGGLLVYLGVGDWIIAIPVYVILLSVVAVMVVTTFWPAIATLHAVWTVSSSPSFNPPYRSIQSWIILQFVLILLTWAQQWKSGVRRRFHELTNPRCENWYQFDALWASWSPRRCRESLLLPLALSAGSKDDMDALYHCFDQWKHTDMYMKVLGTAGGRQLSVLRFMASHGVSLPPSTIGKWETRFMEHLVRTINSGTPISDLGPMLIESRLSMRKATLESILQLLNTLVIHGDLERQTNERVWNLLWGALLAAIMHPRLPDSMLPPIINDVLDIVAKGVANGNAESIFSLRFMSLISLVSQAPLSPTDRVVLRTFAKHPTWTHIKAMNDVFVQRFVRVAETVPPEGDLDQPFDLSRLLEEIMADGREGRRSFEPRSGNSIINEAPQEETVLDGQLPVAGTDSGQMV